MGSVKNRVRNKLFKCFRPAAMDDDSIKPDATDGSGNSVFTCISGEGKSGKISNSLSGEKGKVYLEGGDAGGDRSNKERSHRSFSAAVKAVLFDASLKKKPTRNRKARQISNSSNINMSSEISQKVSKPSSHDHEKPSKRDSSAAGDWKTNYSYWSSSLDSSFPTTFSTDHSLSSSHLSSLALDSAPWSEHKESFRAGSVESKQTDGFISTDDVREYRRVDIGLCMFVISFSVLIFGGRVCAIFCTLMLFLLFDGPGKRIDSARCRIELPEIGSEEHKKKVIMEGLLERNHSRLL